MRANRLPAASGLRWIAGGFLIFRAAPLRQLALDFAFLMALGIVVGLPAVGFVAVWVLLPASVVGPHALARAAARGAAPGFAALVSGLRRNLAAQLRLGLLYLAAMALVLAASAAADGGSFAGAMVGREPLDIADLQRPEVELAMTLGAALQTAALGALWYAPLLVGWNGLPAARAAFYSAAAVAINWRAFLAYGAGITLLFAGVLTAGLGAVVLFSRTGSAQANMALFSSVLALLPVWFGSSYLSYVEVFGEVPPAPGGAPGPASRPPDPS